MIKRFALISAGVVTNVILAEQTFIDSQGMSAIEVAGNSTVGVGDTYSGGIFSRPAFVPPVPQSVTMRQARLALLAAGKLALVQPAIDSLSEPIKSAAAIEWQFSNDVVRSNAFVSMLGAALGMSGGDLDALFVAAGKL